MAGPESEFFRIENPHLKRARWHQWVIDGEMVLRGRTGRKIRGGFYRWIRLVCNNTDCTATALLSEGTVLQLVPIQLQEDG